jgi:hypothetical protein
MFRHLADNYPMNDSHYSQDSRVLTILIDNQSQLTFDRSRPLSDKQLAYLDRMDTQMDEGLQLEDARIEQPDALQRAQFVAVHLIEAMQQGNEALVAASCAYLARRLPDLKQVKALLVEGGFSVELVFDESYARETVVEFVPRPVS